MPLNVGASIGSDAYATASASNAYANAYSTQTTAPKQNGRQTSGGTKKYFRYPLKRLEATSDYLEIKIFDYVEGGFDISRATQSDPIKVTAKNAQERLKAKQTSPKCYILLPIPQNISDTVSVTWGEDTINAISAGGIAAANSIQDGDIIGAFNAMKTATESALGNSGTMEAVKNLISSTAVNTLGGNVSATGLISRATGMVMNNNLELLFQGVNLRSFPFTFDLAPRSREEAQEIKLIIRTLKQEMTARYNAAKVGGNTENVGLFISSPSIFQLTYKSGNRKHPFLHTFKPCALTGCGVNYTASGTYATYENGTPVHMQLTLEFKELNPIYSEDYENEDSSIGVGY